MQADSEEILTCCLCNLSRCPDFVHVNDGSVKRDEIDKPIILVISHLMQSLGKLSDPESAIILRSQYICNLCVQELNDYDEAVERLQKIQERLKQMISISHDQNEICEQFFPYQSEVNSNHKDEDLNDYLIDMSDIADNIIEESDELFGDTDSIDVTDLQFETETKTEWPSPLNEEIIAVEENFEDFKKSCLKCNKVFFNPQRFHDHEEFEHRNDPNVLVCRICHRLFRSLEVLLLHKNIHEGKTEKQCRYCDKRYTKKENVLRHMQIHWFPNKVQLSSHMQKHQMESAHVECEICIQVFKNKRTLKTHMLTHNKDRVRYKCNFCLKSFTEKYRLKLHCQNQHAQAFQ